MNQPNHVLVTGGSRGLGEVIVQELLNKGYSVSAVSRSKTPFTEQTAERHPDRFFFAACDVQDPLSIATAVDEAKSTLGTPYGLINNAGVALDGVLAMAKYADIEKTIGINLFGALATTREVLRSMLIQKRGRIINISSIIGNRGYSGLSVYAATKGGLDAMTRSLARELGSRQITVNSIAPGYLETEMTHGLSDSQKGQIVRRTPLGRLGKPEDIVGLVLYLLSDQAAYLTGQVITVDGGITC